ncbi:MAG: Ribosomal protein S12 methylthiotransferase RimO [Candidatus Aerophobetes bacterium ADurb.Bin490]|nr:MAG: Ribosomal protein S12 methylthiotransferase RimO [Candidatus Aerophobetes bacterium ADurb.Bin490]
MFINPPRVDGYPVVREERFEHKDMGSVYPPLSLLYMAAVINKDENIKVNLIDANGFDLSMARVKEEMAAFSPDIVVTRCGFDTQQQDMEVLKEARAIGAITVLRNKIISEVPEIRDSILKARQADVFIDSEPESVIHNLCREAYECKKSSSDGRISEKAFLGKVPGISFLRNNEVITNNRAAEISDINSLPFPAYELLPSLNPYHTGVMSSPFALVQTTRGCPFLCTFCAYGKSKCRERNVESVIQEIKYLKSNFSIKSFLFFDDTISIKGGRIEELCKRMEEEGLNTLEWVCCTRANLVNYEMLKAMKKAGMKEIAIGVETGSAEILKLAKKGVTLEDIRQAAKWCKELGIMFYALVIIGLPGETKETVKETIKFIKEIDPFYTQVCFSTPFPNTDIYKYYEENGFLLTKDWSKYFPLSEEPVVRTQALTAEDLKKLRNYIYKKLLFRPLYLLRKVRPFDWKWNIEGAKKIMQRIAAVIMKKPVR